MIKQEPKKEIEKEYKIEEAVKKEKNYFKLIDPGQGNKECFPKDKPIAESSWNDGFACTGSKLYDEE